MTPPEGERRVTRWALCEETVWQVRTSSSTHRFIILSVRKLCDKLVLQLIDLLFYWLGNFVTCPYFNSSILYFIGEETLWQVLTSTHRFIILLVRKLCDKLVLQLIDSLFYRWGDLVTSPYFNSSIHYFTGEETVWQFRTSTHRFIILSVRRLSDKSLLQLIDSLFYRWGDLVTSSYFNSSIHYFIGEETLWQFRTSTHRFIILSVRKLCDNSVLQFIDLSSYWKSFEIFKELTFGNLGQEGSEWHLSDDLSS
jgi:hypothetical protein